MRKIFEAVLKTYKVYKITAYNIVYIFIFIKLTCIRAYIVYFDKLLFIVRGCIDMFHFTKIFFFTVRLIIIYLKLLLYRCL